MSAPPGKSKHGHRYTRRGKGGVKRESERERHTRGERNGRGGAVLPRKQREKKEKKKRTSPEAAIR